VIDLTDVKINIDKVGEILELADCSSLSKIEVLSGGWANSNYLVTCDDKTKVVLKIWREKTPDEVQEMNLNIDWIVKHGVSTPAPLKLKNGESMIVVDGFAWILIPFINAPWIAQDTASLNSLGLAIASLHAVPNAEHFGSSYSMGVDIWPELFERAESEDKWSPFLRMLEEEFIKSNEKIPSNLPKGAIHGDLFQDNILGHSGEVLAILDFEDMCFNILAIDLVVAFIGCCWIDEKPVEELWFSLLSGYESVRPLSPEERAALPELYRYASLSVAAWRYRKFILDEEDSEHAGRYLLMMKGLEESVEFLTEIRK
jgi:homoserine kinase type II